MKTFYKERTLAQSVFVITFLLVMILSGCSTLPICEPHYVPLTTKIIEEVAESALEGPLERYYDIELIQCYLSTDIVLTKIHDYKDVSVQGIIRVNDIGKDTVRIKRKSPGKILADRVLYPVGITDNKILMLNLTFESDGGKSFDFISQASKPEHKFYLFRQGVIVIYGGEYYQVSYNKHPYLLVDYKRIMQFDDKRTAPGRKYYQIATGEKLRIN